MRKLGWFALSVALLAAGCGNKYSILRGSKFDNPPKGEVRIALEGSFPETVRDALRRKEVRVYRDLRGNEVVTKETAVFRTVPNPFTIVSTEEKPDLIISGTRSTERLSQRGMVDYEAPKMRQITFTLKVTELATEKVLMDEQVKKFFPPDKKDDAEMFSYIFLAHILDVSLM